MCFPFSAVRRWGSDKVYSQGVVDSVLETIWSLAPDGCGTPGASEAEEEATAAGEEEEEAAPTDLPSVIAAAMQKAFSSGQLSATQLESLAGGNMSLGEQEAILGQVLSANGIDLAAVAANGAAAARFSEPSGCAVSSVGVLLVAGYGERALRSGSGRWSSCAGT